MKTNNTKPHDEIALVGEGKGQYYGEVQEWEILNDVLKVKINAEIKYGKRYRTISAVTGLRKAYGNKGA